MLMVLLLVFVMLWLLVPLALYGFAQCALLRRKSSPRPASKEDSVSNALEILLRKAGRDLMDYQVARIFKVPEEMQQTPCDFFGYTVHGRAILIEAKMVTRTSLPINDKSNGLSIHQWNELEDANKAGALALICWAQEGVCKTITMDMAIELSRGRRSIPWKKIEKRFSRSMEGANAHLALLDHWLPISRS
jgi:hypothetical protein